MTEETINDIQKGLETVYNFMTQRRDLTEEEEEEFNLIRKQIFDPHPLKLSDTRQVELLDKLNEFIKSNLDLKK